MAANIKFGHSGWRGTIAEDFTALKLYALAVATAKHVTEDKAVGFTSADYERLCSERKAHHKNPLVVLSYDTRFLSRTFARLAAEAFSSNAVMVKLSDKPAPTPAVACAVQDRVAAGGATITASEGAHQYSGFKWTPYWGGAAPEEVTLDIETRCSITASTATKINKDLTNLSPLVELVDLRTPYFKRICSQLDLPALKKSGLKVGVDPLYGAASAYLRPLAEQLGLKAVAIHENRDVTFGGRPPYAGPESLAELSKLVLKNKLNIGLACDCDGDRFGIVDEKGHWVSPNEVLALVLGHIVKNRGLKGRVCKNVVTSHLVNLMAKSVGCEVRETPVGFRHIGELMRTGNYVFGGEESGGLTILGHVPDKDGILACLLMVELLAYEKKPLSVLRANLKKQFGEFYSQKISVPLGDFNFTAVSERLSVKPPLDLAGFSVWRIDQTDGFKFILRDGSWLGLRHSGVEHLVRLYAESTSPKKLAALVAEGKKIIRGDF